MSRLDHWKKERRLRPVMIVKDDRAGDDVRKLAEARWDAAGPSEDDFGLGSLLESSHEVIFEIREGQPIFHLVGWLFDPELFELVLARSWEVGDLDPERAKLTLGRALMNDTPVYPNTPADEPPLMELHRALIEVGIKDSSGKTYRLTRYARLGEAEDIVESLSTTETLSAGEMMLLRQALERRAAEHVEAGTVLAGLRAGIAELTELLNAENVKEARLQTCLTQNPLLFGAQYREVRPKHSLGSEYEMDYALVRLGGSVDLVEIEKAADPLYTKAGNPSAKLVHAEQQVLDWLAWIDKYPGYAERNLPGLERPIGYVVIGRDASLDEAAGAKLAQRNAALKGRVEILTFDALIDRGEAILAALTGTGGVDGS